MGHLHRPNSSPDTSPCGLSAECQRIPATIRRRLRAITSPRWRLTMLISTMLFVGSSASGTDPLPTSSTVFPDVIVVNGAGTKVANGLYYLKDTAAPLPGWGRAGVRISQIQLPRRPWYENDNGCRIIFHVHCNDWNIFDSNCNGAKGSIYQNKTSPPPLVPPATGWKPVREDGEAPAPALSYQCLPCSRKSATCDQAVLCGVGKHCSLCGGKGTIQTWPNLRDWQELALQKILPPELCLTDTNPVGHGPKWIAISDTTRRRLTSDAVGYGSSETPDRWRLWKDTSHGASSHRRTGRLLASEATGSAC